MHERFVPMIEWVVTLLELTGVIVVVAGFIIATGHWLLHLRTTSTHAAYLQYRRRSVRGLILGLEFLVAADIIRTVTMDYTLSSLLELGLIVLIRTFLVFALHLEIDGYLPWQRDRERDRMRDASPAGRANDPP